MAERFVYVVFSSTPYRIGRFIRRVTREPYNHVSIALDEELTQMYGFARRYFRTPFYGGFVKESTSRYRFGGMTAQIRLCRISITEEQYQQLTERFAEMFEQREQYLYNYLSMFSAPFRRLIPVKNAYICVEFVVKVLHDIGLPLDPKKYYSVGKLEALLRPNTVYTGPIPDSTPYDEAYYSRSPVPHPHLTSLKCLLALFPRLGR